MTAIGARSERRLSEPWSARRVGRILCLVVGVGGGLLALRTLDIDLLDLYRGARNSTYLHRALPPRWGGEYSSAVRQLVRTVLMAAAGTGMAAVFAFPIGLLAAGNLSPHPVIRLLARGLITFCRATPDIVFATIFVLAVSIGEHPGVMALALHSIGMLGKLLADRSEEIDEKPREAALAAGAGRLQAIVNSALPQVMPSYISTIVYRFDINLRAATVVGVVGGGGIGQLIVADLQNARRYRAGIAMSLMLAAIILIVDFLSTRLRDSLAGVETRNLRELREDEGVATKTRSLVQPWTRDRMITTSAMVGMLAFWTVAMSAIGMWPWQIAHIFLRAGSKIPAYFPPSFDGVSYKEHVDGAAYLFALKDTMSIATGAAFLALVFAIPMAFLIAKSTTPFPALRQVLRTFIASLRAIPDIALVLFLISMVGLQTPFPAAFALALGVFSFISKLIADDLDGVGAGPQEAVRAGGATHRQQVVAAVVPSAMPMLVGHGLYGYDGAVRGTLLLGTFTGLGFGWIFIQAGFFPRPYPAIAACVITIYATVLLIEFASTGIRRYLL